MKRVALIRNSLRVHGEMGAVEELDKLEKGFEVALTALRRSNDCGCGKHTCRRCQALREISELGIL